jgi:hypothetical protein
MQRHRASSSAHPLGIGAIGVVAYATIMQACQTRKGIGLTKLDYTALMLDPRPHVPRSASQCKNSTEDNFGNTPVIRSGRFWRARQGGTRYQERRQCSQWKQATLVLCKQMQAWLEVHPKLVTRWLDTKLLLHAQASVLSSYISETGVCLQVSPTHTRGSLGIKGAELQAFGSLEHPSSFWQLHVVPCVLLQWATR